VFPVHRPTATLIKRHAVIEGVRIAKTANAADIGAALLERHEAAILRATASTAVDGTPPVRIRLRRRRSKDTSRYDDKDRRHRSISAHLRTPFEILGFLR
jgi:hypothetical protein